MKILVDTSVWADFFNNNETEQVKKLCQCIADGEEIGTCGLIISEFFQGLKTEKAIKEIRPYFQSMTMLTPVEPGTYFDAANLFRKLRKKGVSIRSTIDCIIACIASDAGFSILSSDRDFKFIARSELLNLRII